MNPLAMPVPTITITTVSPGSDEAVDLLRALDDDLRRRYPGIQGQGLRPQDVADARLVFLIARADRTAIGCGAVRALGPRVGEVKRMFVREEWRGQGVARRLLAALEAEALSRGYLTLCLETGGRQPEAIALYRSAGYLDVAPFGEYVGNTWSVCFEKQLA